MVDNEVQTSVSPNESLINTSESISSSFRDSTTSPIKYTSQQTLSVSNVSKDKSAGTIDSENDKSIQLSTLSSSQPQSSSSNDECTQILQVAKTELQNNTKIEYFENFIRCDVSGRATETTSTSTNSMDTKTNLFSNSDKMITKTDEEVEVLIKLTEPESHCLSFNTEQIDAGTLAYLENTSRDNIPLNSSKNMKLRNQKTQPIPKITPSNLEAPDNIGRIPEVQIRSEYYTDSIRDLQPEVGKQVGEPISKNQITQATVYVNTEYNTECHKTQQTISNKQNGATSDQNNKVLTIQIEDKNLKDSQQATANVIKLKSSENNETKFTISFQFRKDQELQHLPKAKNNTDSDIFKEVAIRTVDLNVSASSNDNSSISLLTKVSILQDSQKYANTPFIILKSPMPSNVSQPAVTTPQPFQIFTSIPSLLSPISVLSNPPFQPKTLFLQALAKLNENSINVAVIDNSNTGHTKTSGANTNTLNSSPTGNMETTYSELSAPDSLTCAPPSYSFVLRQSARRRPRLIGTFVPSPSFVRKTPPPTYAAAFDIYIDSPVPPPANRAYNYGFTAMPVVCPECGFAGVTVIISKITLCTHLCALLLCLFCCWICAPLPYVMRSCKDVYHYCRNCRSLLGVYRPYSPESAESPYIAQQ